MGRNFKLAFNYWPLAVGWSIHIGLLCSLWVSCQNNSRPDVSAPVPTAAELIRQAIERHGGERYADSQIEFDFRDRHYVAWRQGGNFRYERIFTDTAGRNVRDVLTNNELRREINGEPVNLSAKDSSAYANSVNSVIYFALLPYFLQDPAVIATYEGERQINGQPYHRIGVTFRREGGGKDFQDQYAYWLHRDSLTMDYLAYNFQEDGGGARFRSPFNIRRLGGIRFIDFVNYEPQPASMNVLSFDSLYQAGGLDTLSLIELENVEVEVLSD